jgi:hypothetical protein
MDDLKGVPNELISEWINHTFDQMRVFRFRSHFYKER